jgi:uncharacterized protein YicC (UPF0701 family)
MIKITVTKTVEQGKVKWNFDGMTHEMARQITGHTSESNHSIFRDNANENSTYDHISYGNHRVNPAKLSGYPQLMANEDTASERAEKIKARLVSIRSWVQDCKAADRAQEGTATVEIPPTIEDLQAEIALLREAAVQAYSARRDEKGKFVKSA